MTEPTSTNDPLPPAAPPKPRWWRSRDDRYLAGVAGGLGERFDVDPLFIRIAFVTVTLLAGDDGLALAPVLYGLAWLALPMERGRSLVSRLDHDHDARLEAGGAVALALAVAVLIPRLGPGGSNGLRFGALLLGLAVLLLGRRSDGPPPHDGGGPSVPTHGATAWDGPSPHDDGGRPVPPEGATGWDGPPAQDGGGRPVAADGATERPTTPPDREPPSPPWAWRRPAVPRRRPRTVREPALWPLTLALLAAFAVVCVVLDTMLGSGLDPGLAASGALLIVGGVLVLSAWRGRARSTILAGLALLPVWLAFVPGDVERFEGEGDRLLRPATVDEASGRHELGYGHLELDLGELELRPGTVLRTGVAVTAGAARVVVPSDVELVVRGPVGFGVIGIEGADPWHHDERLVVQRMVSRRFGPQPRRCGPQTFPVDGLSFPSGSFATLADLTAWLERRGWDAPTPAGWDEVHGTAMVDVDVDQRGRLCDDSLPDVPPDPANVTLDIDLGLAGLEVVRVPVD